MIAKEMQMETNRKWFGEKIRKVLLICLVVVILIAAIWGIATVYEKSKIEIPKPDYVSLGGDPNILNNPFASEVRWFEFRRLDGKKIEDVGMSPDQFILDVYFEPVVVKFPNGQYRITLKTGTFKN